MHSALVAFEDKLARLYQLQRGLSLATYTSSDSNTKQKSQKVITLAYGKRAWSWGIWVCDGGKTVSWCGRQWPSGQSNVTVSA